MSVHVTSWVLKHSPVGGNDRLVLLSLADKAGEGGDDAYPSLRTLAHEARCSEDTARRSLRRLEAGGHIADEGFGPRGTRRWRVVMDPQTGGGSKLQGVAQDTLGGGTAMPPEPSKEPSSYVFGRAREAVKFDGKAVDPLLVADAEEALGYFSHRAGQALRPRTGTGAPSESLKRIIGAMLAHPSLRTNYKRVIDCTLQSAWWGDDPPSVGVIFGPKVVEQSIARASAPRVVQIGGRRRNGTVPTARPSDFAHLFETSGGDPA